MANVNFRQGSYSGFSALTSYEAGTFYVTTDEQGIYLATASDKTVKLGNIITYNTLTDWEQATKPPYSADVFYYITTGNALIKWNGSKFVQLNKSYDGDVSTLQKAIDDLSAVVATKADQEATTNALALKANAADVYTKTEVDTELGKKANSADVYTKTAADGKFATITTVTDLTSTVDGKADKATTLAGYGITDAYTKTQVNTELAKKADKATTLEGYGITDAYTKTQVNDALDLKANKTTVDDLTTTVNGKADKATTLEGYGITDAYTKTQADSTFAKKATTLAGYGITDAYTKTQVDDLINPLATKTQVSNLETSVSTTYETKEDATSKLTEAKGYTDTLANGAVATNTKNITDEIDRATKAEEAIAEDLTSLENKVDDHISAANTNLSNTLKEAKEYSDANLATAKKYTNDEIAEALAAADSMKFMGVIGGSGNITALPAAANTHAGETYKVGAVGDYAGYRCYVGDLLIAKEDGKAEYYHITSGYEDDYNTRLGVDADNKKIVLNSPIGVDHGSVTFVGDYTESLGGVKVVVAGTEDATTHQADSTVTISMVWGSF